MANFKLALAKVLKSEGVWSNDKADTGGATYKGIAYKKNPNWPGWAIIKQHYKDKDFPACLESIPELQTMVEQLYKKQYWDTIGGDKIKSDIVAFQLFDTAVNMGVTAAVSIAAQTVGIAETSMTDKLITKLNEVT